MNFEEITSEWQQDCIIDKQHLADESLKTPSLHAKYLERLITIKSRLIRYESEYTDLRNNKFRYYRGEFTKKELEALGWEQYQGTKPLKSDMDEFLSSDKDLTKLKTRIEYCEMLIYQLENIIKMISSRDWQIRNALEHMKFVAGN